MYWLFFRKRIQNKLYLESSNDDILDGIIGTGEPRYCYCDQVAFGTMIACDNKKVCTIVNKKKNN